MQNPMNEIIHINDTARVYNAFLDRCVDRDAAEQDLQWEWGDDILTQLPPKPEDPNARRQGVSKILQKISEDLALRGVHRSIGTLRDYAGTAEAYANSERSPLSYAIASILYTQPDRVEAAQALTANQGRELVKARKYFDKNHKIDVSLDDYLHFIEARKDTPGLSLKDFLIPEEPKPKPKDKDKPKPDDTRDDDVPTSPPVVLAAMTATENLQKVLELAQGDYVSKLDDFDHELMGELLDTANQVVAVLTHDLEKGGDK
jgi:hypothetical protein